MRSFLRLLLPVVVSLGALAAGRPASADLLVSSNANAVLRYDERTGAPLSNPFGTGGELAGPIGMTLSPDGITHLYVASVATNSVERFNVSDGSFVDRFVTAGSGGLSGPWGVAFGPDGNLYVSSSSTDQVMRYNGTTGAPMPAAGNSGAVYVTGTTPDIDYAMDIAFGPDGNLYVVSGASGQIMIYQGPNGATPGAPIDVGHGLGISVEAGTVSAPQFLTFHNGDIYVGDFSIVQNTVMRYQGPNGAAPGDPVNIGKGPGVFVSSGAGGLQRPTGVVFGPDGNLYVSSTDNDEVIRYNGTTGDPIGVFVASGSGGLFAPQELVFSNPEPGTMLLFGAGLAGFAALGRRRRRSAGSSDETS